MTCASKASQTLRRENRACRPVGVTMGRSFYRFLVTVFPVRSIPVKIGFFVPSHSSAATRRGVFGWVIIIVLSIRLLIGLVSLIPGSEESGIIGFDYQEYSYLCLDPETHMIPGTDNRGNQALSIGPRHIGPVCLFANVILLF